MNPLSLHAVSVLAIVSSSFLITIPGFGQTTIVPITGGSFSVTTVGNSGSLNPGAVVLTPIGTINVSGFQINSFQNFNTGLNTATGTPANGPDNPGDQLRIQGLSSGTISSTGVPFSNAPSIVNGEISSITFLPIGAVPPTSSVTSVNITGGSIDLPSTIVNSANPQSVPITGGNFNVTAFKDGSVVNNGTNILTTLGTVNISSFAYTKAFNETTGFAPFTGGRFPIVGDNVSAEGLTTGTAQLEDGKVANLNLTPTILRGVLTGVQITPAGATPGNQTSENYIGNITSGSFLIPNSSISSANSSTAKALSTNELNLANFTISPSAFSSQRYNFPPSITNFNTASGQVPPPAVSISRIHPGLRSR